MPRTRSLAWSELKIGVMAVAALALTALLVVAVGGASGFAWERYDLKTSFENVQGLKSGAIVRVAGVEVGKVTSVELKGTGVEVVLSLKKENMTRVTSESRASIGAMSLLGEPLIDVSPSTAGTPLKDGDSIKSNKPATQISDVAASAHDGINEATALLKDIRGGKGAQSSLELLPVPGEYRWAPPQVPGPSTNVAQAYAHFARDYRDGTQLCPTFEDAVTRHRMLDAIETAAATGQRHELG